MAVSPFSVLGPSGTPPFVAMQCSAILCVLCGDQAVGTNDARAKNYGRVAPPARRRTNPARAFVYFPASTTAVPFTNT
jgi:hypothetical protein